MKNLMWYTKGVNDYLCHRGFVQFSTREPVNFDFKEGRAFFFDEEERTLGLVDMIPNGKIDNANKLTSEYRSTGEIGIVDKLK